MHTEDYVKNAIRTESQDFEAIAKRLSDTGNIRLLHGGIGLATEAGEFLDALKKHVYYGKELDRVNLSEELGDLFWYCAIIAHELDVPFAKIMQTNIDKLRARYGEKFSEERADKRDLATERTILES